MASIYRHDHPLESEGEDEDQQHRPYKRGPRYFEEEAPSKDSDHLLNQNYRNYQNYGYSREDFPTLNEEKFLKNKQNFDRYSRNEELPLSRPVAPRPRDHRFPIIFAGLISFLLMMVAGIMVWNNLFGSASSPQADVPLIKADKTPVKIKPDNEGGLNVPDQDKKIYEKIDPTMSTPSGIASGMKQDPVKLSTPQQEAILPPTSAGTDNQVIETPPVSLSNSSVEVIEPSDANRDMNVLETKTPQLPGQVSSALPKTQNNKNNISSANITPREPSKVTSVPTTIEQSPPVEEISAKSQTVSKQPDVQASIKVVNSVNTPKAILKGSSYAQLGSLKIPDAAQKEMVRISKVYQQNLESLPLIIKKVDLGSTKGITYRILAGPLADTAAVNNLCGKLKQLGQACILAR
ncbi:MAG: SPOR domain-containing protein [Alphaproteobacteria bacterium]|nr:SPOR domain-containing protein [Alphaproteobacteria bacterium]